MNSIEKRIERLEKPAPFAGYDPSRPMVIVLRDGDPDYEPLAGDGPGPLVIDCRQSGRDRPITG